MIQDYDGGQKDIFVRGCCLVSFVRFEKFIIISEEGRKRERERILARFSSRRGKKGAGRKEEGGRTCCAEGPSLRAQFENCVRVRRTTFFFCSLSVVRTILMHLLILTRVVCSARPPSKRKVSSFHTRLVGN